MQRKTVNEFQLIKKASYNATSDYVLVVLLLVFSGNPVIRYLDKSILIVLSALILFVKYAEVKNDFYIKFFLIASSLGVLFVLQNFILNFVSWLGAFNYISKFLFGGLVLYLVAERFSFRFFIVLYYISLISLVGFVLINLLGLQLPGLEWRPQRVTHVLYTFVQQHYDRNCGMFWEPGAFAGVILLCLALNARYLPALWKNHKFKIIVIITALLTTKSTTGYLVFFVIVLYYLAFFIKSNWIKFALIPSLIILTAIVYANAEFLQEKIDKQTEKSAGLSKGDFSNSRFGSYMLDKYYIEKHPLLGNGLHEKTRYADDPQLIQQIKSGDDIASGNGFSNYLASLGIPFMFFYLLITFSTISKVDTKLAFLVIFVMVLSLWGEQWLNYPIYTGIMFLNIKNYTDET